MAELWAGGWERMCINWNERLDIRENVFSVEIDKLCKRLPVKLCSLHAWKFSRHNWIKSWAICSTLHWNWFEQETELQIHAAYSMILWNWVLYEVMLLFFFPISCKREPCITNSAVGISIINLYCKMMWILHDYCLSCCRLYNIWGTKVLQVDSVCLSNSLPFHTCVRVPLKFLLILTL